MGGGFRKISNIMGYICIAVCLADIILALVGYGSYSTENLAVPIVMILLCTAVILLNKKRDKK